MDYSLWKATKRLRQPAIGVPPLRSPTGEWVRSDQDNADLFADQLANIFTTHDSPITIKPELTFESKERVEYFTPRDIALELDKLNPRKVAG